MIALPEDFDSFWQGVKAEAESVPLDYSRSLKPVYELQGFNVEELSFRSVSGRLRHGWVAIPDSGHRHPAFLCIPPYGRESLLPNEYGTRAGFVSFSFNLHGHGAFHQEKYTPDRGYMAEGAEDPESWIFRALIQDCLVATRVLRAQFEVNEDRVGAIGMSQGAGMAIWLGAMSPVIKAVCADMPFLCSIRTTLLETVYRYPLKEFRDYMDRIPLGEHRVLNTLSYFDTVHLATRCHKPSHIALGTRDPASRPASIRVAFDVIPGTKHLVEYDWGHDWHPEMVDRNRNWLLSYL